MHVKIYANLASEQIYALFIYAFLSIKIQQHLLLLTDYRYISILRSVAAIDGYKKEKKTKIVKIPYLL